MLVLKCPTCGHSQRYSGVPDAKKRKACVYCGKSFLVRTHILRKE